LYNGGFEDIRREIHESNDHTNNSLNDIRRDFNNSLNDIRRDFNNSLNDIRRDFNNSFIDINNKFDDLKKDNNQKYSALKNTLDNLGIYVEKAFTYKNNYSINRADELQKFTSPVYFPGNMLTKFGFFYDGYVGELTDNHFEAPYNKSNNSTDDLTGTLWRAADDIDLAISSGCPTTDFVINLGNKIKINVGENLSTLGYAKTPTGSLKPIFYSGELSFQNHSFVLDCKTPFSGCNLGFNNMYVMIGSQVQGMSGSPVVNFVGVCGMTSALQIFSREIHYESKRKVDCLNISSSVCRDIADAVNEGLNLTIADFKALQKKIAFSYISVTTRSQMIVGIKKQIEQGHVKTFSECNKIKEVKVLTLSQFPKYVREIYNYV
jgi:hypothetical protein